MKLINSNRTIGLTRKAPQTKFIAWIETINFFLKCALFITELDMFLLLVFVSNNYNECAGLRINFVCWICSIKRK